MKITVNTKELIEALNKVSLVLEDNKIRPALAGILINADDKLELVCTNLEQTIKIELDASVEIKGQTILSKEAIEIIKLNEQSEIEIAVENNVIKIEGGEFSTFDSNEYPKIKIEMDGGKEIEITEYIKAIEQVKFAADKKLDNVELNSVRIDKKFIAATDRFRMAYKECLNPLIEAYTLPFSSAIVISKLFGKTDGGVITASKDDTKLVFKDENIIYMSRLINAPFPDIAGIINSTETNAINKVIVNVKNLKKIIAKVKIVINNNFSKQREASFIFSKNKLIVKAIGDRSKLKEEMRITNDNDFKVSLDCQFLEEFIKNITGNNVEILYSNSQSALILIEEGNPDYKYLTMPLAIKEE